LVPEILDVSVSGLIVGITYRGVADFRRYFRAFHPVLQRVSSFLTDIESCSVVKVWWTREAAPPYLLGEL
jgi:uncharacterized membrane protein